MPAGGVGEPSHDCPGPHNAPPGYQLALTYRGATFLRHPTSEF